MVTFAIYLFTSLSLRVMRQAIMNSTHGFLSVSGGGFSEENVIRLATSNVKKSINSGVIAGHGSHVPTPTFMYRSTPTNYIRECFSRSLSCRAAFPVHCVAASRYRTITGICNNLKHNVLWGSQSSGIYSTTFFCLPNIMLIF